MNGFMGLNVVRSNPDDISGICSRFNIIFIILFTFILLLYFNGGLEKCLFGCSKKINIFVNN